MDKLYTATNSQRTNSNLIQPLYSDNLYIRQSNNSTKSQQSQGCCAASVGAQGGISFGVDRTQQVLQCTKNKNAPSSLLGTAKHSSSKSLCQSPPVVDFLSLDLPWFVSGPLLFLVWICEMCCTAASHPANEPSLLKKTTPFLRLPNQRNKGSYNNNL